MQKVRRSIQTLWVFLSNGFWLFPFTRSLYQGPLKIICAPGLNCYSCPAATSYCLLGSLQQLFAVIRFNLSIGSYFVGAYVLGTMGLLAAAFGRFICGWACPFGLLQEMLYTLPTRKFSIPPFLRAGKYLFLVLFIFCLPLFAVNEAGIGYPWFCKYVCPAGTLEAGLPMLALTPYLRAAAGLLFWSKFVILLTYLGWSTCSSRPFCRTTCPLGAFYGIFNRFSLIRLELNRERCTNCKACHAVCPVEIHFNETPNSPECINCLKCMTEACTFKAISVDFAGFKLYPHTTQSVNPNP